MVAYASGADAAYVSAVVVPRQQGRMLRKGETAEEAQSEMEQEDGTRQGGE